MNQPTGATIQHHTVSADERMKPTEREKKELFYKMLDACAAATSPERAMALIAHHP